MIADLKPYPAMKDSGVPWLGKVPEHWDVVPAWAAYRPKLIRNTGMMEKTVLSLSYGQIIVKPPEKLRGLVPESFETYQIIDPGEIIVRTTDLQNDQNSLRIGYSKNRGIITAAYMCLTTTDCMKPAFGYQFLRTYDLLKIIYGYGSGLRQNLDFTHIKRMPVLIPPLHEQAAIVRFLDHADQRIQRYIRAKQKLIKLLEEQKQVIIHRAVIRGLDPNIRLKPSGMEWLKDIPEHWPIYRAKLLLRQVMPEIPDKAEMVTCFRDGQVTLRRNRRTEGFTNAIKELGYQGIKPGQLVLHSMDAFAGAIGISDSAGKCSPEYVICEPATDSVFLPYYAYLLRSLALRGLFVVLCPSVRERAPRVRFSHFGSFVLPNPPIIEQKKIVEYIQTACCEVDQTLNTTRREIGLLREYRTRLIADVVTGKLDVREAAARLPDEAEEPEPFNETEVLTADGEFADDLEPIPEEVES